MRVGLIFVGLLMGLVACDIPQPEPQMTLAQAEAYCAPRAVSYARHPRATQQADGSLDVGLLAEFPDSYQVQEFYRRCVFAKSAQRPSQKLEYRL